jgi:hypothetical protein
MYGMMGKGPFYDKVILSTRELILEVMGRIFIVKELALMDLQNGKIRISKGTGCQVELVHNLLITVFVYSY